MLNGSKRWQITLLTLIILLLIPKTLNYSEPSEDSYTKIKKIYSTTEAGTFLVYALDPEAVLGWNRGLSPDLEFAIQPEYHRLPILGTWSQEYNTIAIDLVLESEPDLIIHYASVNEDNKRLVSEIEKTLGIPTILMDSSLQALPASLQFVGTQLGKEIRGQALANYVKNCLEQTAFFQKLHQNFLPVPVHIVSSHTPGYFNELLDLAGMVEMATLNNQPPYPDLILIMPHSFLDPYEIIAQDGYKRIYQIPDFPSTWLEPGSIFSLLGVEWLHSIAYPHSYSMDLAEAYTVFMEIFFQIQVTPELLNWTFKRSGISY